MSLRQQCFAAQNRYCDAHEVPHFAPWDGYCPSCGRDIYGEGGYTPNEAGNRLITGCPFCHTTYID